MPHRDFNDLDSAGVPLDATPSEMRELIDGAIRHRKEQNARLSAVEQTAADIKDGQQVLYAGHRRLERGQHDMQAQIDANTVVTKQAAASAEQARASAGRIEVALGDLSEIWTEAKGFKKFSARLVSIFRPVAKAAVWLFIRVGIVAGGGVGGMTLWGKFVEWAGPAIKAFLHLGPKP